jgi:tRNA-dihydrouridine synthase
MRPLPMKNFWSTLEKPIAVLAPMEDVTDTVFRQIVVRCGRPQVFFTEFTSTDGMCSAGREAVVHRLQYTEVERPIVAQIWGTVPEHHYEAARQVVAMGFDGIDLNMGCPVKKIVKNGACSALIDNPNLAAEIIRATREGAGPLPVSVKTRCGFRRWRTEDWCGFLLEQKPVVLTIHGRIAKDESKYPADWDEIGKVARLRDRMGSSTLVLGNGDVGSLKEIGAKSLRYGLDGVMVGRGILHYPYLFRDPEPRPWPEQDRLELLLDHVTLYRDTWGDQKYYGRLKKFYKMYVSSFPEASELRNRMMETESVSEAILRVSHWMTERGLRVPAK